MQLFNIAVSIIAFIITIVILVGIHEYGHYLVARLCKVGVLKFSMGFGKSLYSYTHKKSGTVWTISAIPLGGYVKLVDERNLSPDSPDYEREKNTVASLPKSKKYPQLSFNGVHPLKKIAIILAGPAINFIAAIVFFAIVGMHGSKQIAPNIQNITNHNQQNNIKSINVERISYGSESYQVQHFNDILWHAQIALQQKKNIVLHSNNNIQKTLNLNLQNINAQQLTDMLQPALLYIEILHIQPNSLAEKYQLKPHDKIMAINNENPSAYILSKYLNTTSTNISSTHKKTLNLIIERNQKIMPIIIELKYNQKNLLGINMRNAYQEMNVSYGFFPAIKYGASKTWQVINMTIQAISGMFESRKAAMENLGGPVAISSMAKSSLLAGVDTFLQFLALISISLGIMNLLPLPVLDGGQALMTFVEWIIQRSIPLKVVQVLQQFGVILIMILTILALNNDIQRLL